MVYISLFERLCTAVMALTRFFSALKGFVRVPPGVVTACVYGDFPKPGLLYLSFAVQAPTICCLRRLGLGVLASQVPFNSNHAP